MKSMKTKEPGPVERVAAAFHLLDVAVALPYDPFESDNIAYHVDMLRQELAPLLEEAKKREQPCKHKFTAIAPEISDGLLDDCLIWRWCIRCGRLRLGRETFTPGPHQKMTIVADE